MSLGASTRSRLGDRSSNVTNMMILGLRVTDAELQALIALKAEYDAEQADNG